MARDINDVILTGEVASTPVLSPLKNNKSRCLFGLRNVERYTLANGQPASHENIIDVEILGPRAEQYAREIRVGDRYLVKGYIRVDATDKSPSVKVRAFRVELE
jgi:single-stranded DNA-binding protein